MRLHRQDGAESLDDLLAEFARLVNGEHPRDDHRELLELSIIVLGGEPKRGIAFARPGPCTPPAAIYAVKVYLFRYQVQLTAFEESGFDHVPLHHQRQVVVKER
jgi:hypothetical protein